MSSLYCSAFLAVCLSNIGAILPVEYIGCRWFIKGPYHLDDRALLGIHDDFKSSCTAQHGDAKTSDDYLKSSPNALY